MRPWSFGNEMVKTVHILFAYWRTEKHGQRGSTTFSEEPGLKFKPKGNMSNSLWESGKW